MKRAHMTAAGLCLVLLLTGCATNRSKDESVPAFQGAVVEDGPLGRKKLTLRFSPEAPPYNIVHNRDNTLSEIRWKSLVSQPYRQEFNFANQRGVKKVYIVVDPKTSQGSMTMWHDNTEVYSFSRVNQTELVLLPEDPFRQVSSKDDSKQKKINLNVKGAPLDRIIRTLAAETGRSLVLPQNVTGNVTVSLNNLTYEQALEMILRTTEYRAEHTNDVTIIRKAGEVKTYRSFRLRFVDVNQAIAIIREVAGKDAQMSADPNTNTLFVMDKFENLKNLELVIAQIDQEPRQVEVECAILEIEKKNNFDFGIEWSGTVKDGVTDGGRVTFPVKSVFNPIRPDNPNQRGIFFGLTWQSLNATLAALQTRGTLNLLARPRLLTVTDHEASIILGSRLGYKTTTINQNGSQENVQFLTVGTQLKIKPHITLNNDILMFIKPEISDGTIDPVTNVPNANTTTSENKVLAKNGQTIVIAGLFRDRLETTTERIPLLGDLPVVGAVFGGTRKSLIKTEVVVMLSPRIITPEIIQRHDKQGSEVIEDFYENNGIETPNVIGYRKE